MSDNYQNDVLVIVAHPDLQTSRINKRLTEELERRGAVTVHRLYDVYPDEKIDVVQEQALLDAHKRIVLQFPFYWYSSPSLLKKYFDAVLQRGWAYNGGNHLKGKELVLAISSGGSESMYQAGGFHHFTYSELLRPFQATANRVGMIYRPPYIVSGIREVTDEQLERHAAAYADYVQNLPYATV
ncbi:NAD(P)H-dependent oxidoreductase [Paenibacillus humicola]|uniref:NAD(P)H-dependent oxidoreductase n=1 Tax=Paenibacillus humicola TaxID=3110540 RepID=UPI00237C50E1|nr:NAD(P)H-dependent oxidoreductase [Paenibacillus humicola]